ncbi:MAG: hypothetical protein ABI591_10535 [Kofleriaceae bacterium]
MSITILASNDPTAPLARRLDPATTIVFEDRYDLATKLVALAPSAATTIDLVGLTGSDHLVTLHGRPIDSQIGRVRAFWRELADRGTLGHLGITSLRLVGCLSAVGSRARATLGALSEILQVDVVGTGELVSLADFGPDGFTPHATPIGGRFLDLDALPARPADEGVRVITAAMGHDVLSQIRRNSGTTLPDLLARSNSSLAIPSATTGLFHHVELLLDHELVRTGDVVFHVDDPRELRRIVEA